MTKFRSNDEYMAARARIDAEERKVVMWASRIKPGTVLRELDSYGMTLLGYESGDGPREGTRYGSWYQHQVAPVTDRLWTVVKQGETHVLLVSTHPSTMRFWFEKRLFRRNFRRLPREKR